MPKSPVTPLFDSIQHLETDFKAAKEDGSYAQNKEHYLTIEFLLSYKGSPDTFASYRRELEKLLLWTRNIFKENIKELTRVEIEEFIEFCKKPPKNWTGNIVVSRFIMKSGKRIPNSRWRPFVNKSDKKYSLSDASIRSLFAVLNSYFGFLIQQEYLTVNPLALIRQKRRFLRTDQELPKIRRISNVAKDYVISESTRLANGDPDLHERTLFVIKALLGMYLRISELTETHRWTPKMSDFHKDSDGNWWFFTIGKGNKKREVCVSDEMLEALIRYRKHLELTPLPSPDDDIPLISRQKGQGGINSTRQIRRIVQKCFDKAIEQLKSKKLIEEADELKHATVHWLRHTGISEDVKKRPREHVRDDAGHSSSAITDKYIDVSKIERHKTAKNKNLF